MHTKTARLPPRPVLTPTKRNERDDFDAPSKPSPAKLLKPTALKAGLDKSVAKPGVSNQLLAGYLAHEYLSKGTLFGQPFDPSRSQAVPACSVESRKLKPEKKGEAEPIKVAEPHQEKHQRYVEVASLLKTDGAHLPGIVNPTEFARFLRM